MLESQPLLGSSESKWSKKKLLWRKPLPRNCPTFDFLISEKTAAPPPPPPLPRHTQIPTRSDSKHYQNIPHLNAQLERVCTNKKTIQLTKALRQK